MEPIVNKLIAEGQPIIIVKVPLTAEALKGQGIRAVPALKTYVKGQWKYCNYGVVSEELIRSAIKTSKE